MRKFLLFLSLFFAMAMTTVAQTVITSAEQLSNSKLYTIYLRIQVVVVCMLPTALPK